MQSTINNFRDRVQLFPTHQRHVATIEGTGPKGPQTRKVCTKNAANLKGLLYIKVLFFVMCMGLH